MVNTCVAPGCRAGYREKGCERKKEKLSTFHFPKDESLRNIWVSREPRIGFRVTENSVLCEKHIYSPEDFKSGRIDENSSRRKKKGDKLF